MHMKQNGRRPKKSETVEALMEKADAQGYLTTDDIIEAFPEAEEATDQLDQLFHLLHRAGIEVYEERLAPAVRTRSSQPAEEDPFDLSNISVDDTIGLYLKEMARVPLLTTEQEVDLAKRLERGHLSERRLTKLNGHSTHKRRIELEARIVDGKAAREHLIKANTRLVVSI
ncbi:MAG TPA: sigma-70 factor domain-containing protein, partial [Anaerolineales bacterium]